MRRARDGRALVAIAAMIAAAGCTASAPPPAPAPAPTIATRDTVAKPPGDSIRRETPPPRVTARAVPALELGTSAPAVGPPRLEAGGRVSWAPHASASAESLRAVFREASLSRDPDRVWFDLARIDPRLEPMALRRRAALALAARDTAAAESAFAALARHRTPWQWEALRARADLVAARDPARADAILEVADRRAWPDLERAAWLLRRARLRAEIGDTRAAIELCRRLVSRYPAASPAAQAVPLLEALLASREAGLSVVDHEAAAEIARLQGNPTAGATHLRSALRIAAAESLRVQLSLGRMLRHARQFEAGLNVLGEADRIARDGSERALVALERARIERDAGRTASALVAYGEAARLATAAAPSGATESNDTPRMERVSAETAWWEAALEADRRDDPSRARALYAEVVRSGGARRGEAALRRALLFLGDGAADSASHAAQPDTSPAGRFWRGVLARRLGDRAAGDALLRSVASIPGFGFYETAARDTLGLRGWPGAIARDSCPADSACDALALARDLIVLAETPGFADAARARSDASLIVSRWTAGEARVEDGERVPRSPRGLLAAARLAYALGRLPAAIRFARDAVERAHAAHPAERWAIAPWIAPVAFDDLYGSLPATAVAPAPDRSLVQALTWQESKFDPDARSRSNALGLMQLKLAAAIDAARLLGEKRRPAESVLRDPKTNFRYGVAYLSRLLSRFEGRISVGLTAYNAGPSRVPAAWRRWIAEGGDALIAELVPYPETRDYVKRILTMRHAYRELAPTSMPR